MLFFLNFFRLTAGHVKLVPGGRAFFFSGGGGGMLQQVFPKEPECIVSREPVSAPGSISQQAGSPTQGYSSDIRILLSQTNITALVPVSTGLSLVSCYQQMEVSLTTVLYCNGL